MSKTQITRNIATENRNREEDITPGNFEESKKEASSFRPSLHSTDSHDDMRNTIRKIGPNVAVIF